MERSRSRSGIPHADARHAAGNAFPSDHLRPGIPKVPTRPGELGSQIHRGPERRIHHEPIRVVDGKPKISPFPQDLSTRAAKAAVSDAPPANHAIYRLPTVELPTSVSSETSSPHTAKDVDTAASSPTLADIKEIRDTKTTAAARVTVPPDAPQYGDDPATNTAPADTGQDAPAKPPIPGAGGGTGIVPPDGPPPPTTPEGEPNDPSPFERILENILTAEEGYRTKPEAMANIRATAEVVRRILALPNISEVEKATLIATYAQLGIDHERTKISETLGILRNTLDRLGDPYKQAVQQRDAAERLAAEERRQAQIDPLTSVLSRGGFEAVATGVVEEEGPKALIRVDLDHFKSINDTLGHPIGDALLIMAARVMTESIRPGDNIGRMGGDEFDVLLRESSETALVVAERIRQSIGTAFAPANISRTIIETVHALEEKLRATTNPELIVRYTSHIDNLYDLFENDDALAAMNITASLGVSSISGPTTLSWLQVMADQALYNAKRQGRDLVNEYVGNNTIEFLIDWKTHRLDTDSEN